MPRSQLRTHPPLVHWPHLLLLLPLVFALPAHAQRPGGQQPNADFERVLSGGSTPLTIKAKDLSAAWRQFVLGSPENTMMQAMMAGQGASPSVFYTKGFTISLGGENYLIAYRPQTKLDPQARRRFARNVDEEGNPAAPRLPADATLTLSLLNLRTAGSLNDVRPFDPERDIEKPQDHATQNNMVSVSNLKQLGLALLQYTQDYDEKLPPMNSATSEAQIRAASPPNRQTVQRRLMPYARNTDIFRHPGTRQIYRPNLFLSRKTLASFKSPAAMVAFYEAAPDAEGRRAVLYLDGHVKRERETDWPRIKRASRIPP